MTDLCPFGSTNYSKEELVAEMGASYLCALAGIDSQTVDNSAAYLNGWITKLRGDRRLLVQAGAAAQRAVDLIVGKAPAVMGGEDARQDDRGAP